METGYEEQQNAQRIRYQVGKSNSEQVEPEEIEVNEDLGLACEKLPKGISDID